MIIPVGIVKLLATVGASVSIGLAVHAAVKPPAITPQGRYNQSIERLEDVRGLRQDYREREMRRGLDAESARRAGSSAHSPPPPRGRPPEAGLLRRLWNAIPKPKLRLRLR